MLYPYVISLSPQSLCVAPTTIPVRAPLPRILRLPIWCIELQLLGFGFRQNEARMIDAIFLCFAYR